MVGAEQPDEYGQVQIAYEEQMTPYQRLVAKKREEKFLRKMWKEVRGLRSWKLEDPGKPMEG
jgi:hypothetical protein